MKRIHVGGFGVQVVESNRQHKYKLDCYPAPYTGGATYVHEDDVQPLVRALELATAKAHSEGQGTAYWDAVLATFKASK